MLNEDIITKLIDKLNHQMNYNTRRRVFKSIKKENGEIYKTIKQYFEDKTKLDPKIRESIEKLITVLGLEYK